MKNRTMKRILALLLACAATVSVIALAAGAASYSGDVDGDGKITAFDAQLLAEYKAGQRELQAAQKEAAGRNRVSNIVDFLLGKASGSVGKEYTPGKTSVYTAEDLMLMQELPDNDYVLKANIDMKGAVWTPVVGFSGTFDGNGYTISNLTIEAADRSNLGFFGDTTAESVVTDLALRNVTVNCSGDNRYIGIICGTSRGTMTGYTVTGAICDDRTVMADGSKIVVGAMFGRTFNDCGDHTGGKTITVTDDTGTHKVEGLCGDVKLYIQKDSAFVNHSGQCGFIDKDGGKVSGQWRDSTNCAENESEVMRARQAEVVDYMHEMATVAWQVPEVLSYNADYESGYHKQVFYPGITYYGLPYTHRNGSLNRFLSCMKSQSGGVYMAKSGLGDSCTEDDPMTGFGILMGNDCSSAVNWAWIQVTPSRASGSSDRECAGGAYIRGSSTMLPTDTAVTEQAKDANGNYAYTYTYKDSSGKEQKLTMYLLSDGKLYHVNSAGKYVLGDLSGKTVATSNANLAPAMTTVMKNNQETYGVYPVGNWTTDTYLGDNGVPYQDAIVGEFAYEVPEGAVSAEDFLAANGETVMAEAYALARKADALTGAGHARLLTSYPVTIRNADGTINLKKSFLVCTEQGEGYYDWTDLAKKDPDVSYTNWRINYRFTYYNLLGKDDDNRLGAEDGNPASVGARYSKGVYIPVTMRALRCEYVKYAYLDESRPVTVSGGTISGRIYSNWRIESTKVTVLNGSGSAVFSKSIFTGLGLSGDEYCRGACQYVNFDEIYGDWFAKQAAKNLKENRTYYLRVEVTLSNGETLIVSRDSVKVQQNGHSGTDKDVFVYES